MPPVVLLFGLIGVSLGALAAFRALTRKKDPPSRASAMTLSGLGMACFVAAGAVLYFSKN